MCGGDIKKIRALRRACFKVMQVGKAEDLSVCRGLIVGDVSKLFSSSIELRNKFGLLYHFPSECSLLLIELPAILREIDKKQNRGERKRGKEC